VAPAEKPEDASAPTAVEETPNELETDQAPSRKPIGEQVTFHVQDTTMNLVTAPNNTFLRPLSEGGLQYLLAGARASVGVASGRYMFEIKVVEYVNPEEGRGRAPTNSTQLLRVGFSTSKSSLFLGDGPDSICFEADGSLVSGGQPKKGLCKKWLARDTIVSVLLNLDKKNPNYNTVSLFAGGVRLCDPQALPEALKGKTLFPTVTFKNLTIHPNFGPEPIEPLPFRCRMIGAAEKSDVEVVAAPEAPKDGKHEVLFPIGLPDEGTFDWLDLFLAANPRYTELSDRAILTWCQKSGLHRPRGYGHIASKDKPELNFNLQSLDDLSVRHVLHTVAPMQQRDFVVMELRGNLIKEERDGYVTKFPSAFFRRTACVVIGEPTPEFRRHSFALILKDKQEKSDTAFKVQQAEAKRKRLAEKRQKEAEKAKKKAEAKRLKLIEEKKKKLEQAAAKKAAAEKKAKEIAEKMAKGEEVLEEEEEEDKEEEPKPMEVEEDAEEEEHEEPEPPEEEPPRVKLTPEEKAMKFFTSSTPDLTAYALGTSFTKFSLPAKGEGFDDIRFEWNKGTKCDEHLKSWILDKKQTSRVEDISPSAWFQTQWTQWQRVSKEWSNKLNAYKAAVSKKAADKKAKALKKEAVKKAAAIKKEAERKKKEAEKKKKEAEKKDGEAGEDGDKEEDKEEEEEDPEKEEEEEAEEEEVTVDFETIDIFGVENVLDVGGGMPLFVEFTQEDWIMMGLRFELSTLVHAFKRDCNDPDRTGIHIDHLGFYYQKYYKKNLDTRAFGVDSTAALVALVKDTLYVTKQQVVETALPDEMETHGVFVQLAEEARRYRNVLVDSGEESAKLQLQVRNLSGGAGGGGGGGNRQQGQNQWSQNQGKGGGKWSGGKGGGNWGGGGGRSHPYYQSWRGGR